MSRRLVASVPLALVLGVALWVAPAQAVGHAARRGGVPVAVTATNSPFSPNGDGSKDRGTLSYRLAKRAYVRVGIFGGGRWLLTQKLGRQKKGAHTWTWNGTRAGRVVADGTYTIKIASRRTRHGKPRLAYGALAVDARYGSLGIGVDTLSSNVVYPHTTVIHDEVVGIYSQGVPSGDLSTIRRQVIDSRGHVIDSEPLSSVSGHTELHRYTWDGHDSSGAVVAPGRYRVELVRGRDRAGNPRLLVPPHTVTVSTQRLVARTTTLSAPAQAFTRRDTCYHGPMDCFTGSGTDSARFPLGLSYISGQITSEGSTFYNTVFDIYVLPVNGRGTPYDTFTVTAHGGPTTAGDNDTATLSAYIQPAAGTVGQRSVVLQGDTTGTISAVPSLGMSDPYEVADGGIPGPVLEWGFHTNDGNSYDAASFDITYTRYVLPNV